MADIGFSYQNSPLVFDSFMVPPNISNNLSTSIQEETTCFSHICPFDYFLQDIPLHPPLLDTISTSTTTSNPNSSSSSSMKLETRAQNQAISKVVTGSMVKSREKKKKKKIIDISKVEKEGNKKGRKEKRKSDAMLKVITEEKKLKAAAEDHHHHHKKAKKEDDNITPTTTTTGYVHVRARRGEATDSHSLAERVRREKIGERMRLLQSLVPGCDKIRGKAQVLDKIINYVQSIQNQVEFLLAKLASVGPMFNEFEYDFDANPLVSEGNGVPLWKINEQIRLELVNQDAELNNLYHFY